MDKKTFGYVVVLGSTWGLAECALGAGLHACAASISGSVMTAVALFFASAAWSAGRKPVNVALLVVIALGFKMFDALLLGLPVRSGAIGNPMFAFALEGAGFLAVFGVLPRIMKPGAARAALGGGASALLAVAAFPLVKFATGIPACVISGGSLPMAWAYAPIAVALSALSVPLGLKAARRDRIIEGATAWRVPAAVLISLALIIAVRAIGPA